jgi:hypothetical protein
MRDGLYRANPGIPECIFLTISPQAGSPSSAGIVRNAQRSMAPSPERGRLKGTPRVLYKPGGEGSPLRVRSNRRHDMRRPHSGEAVKERSAFLSKRLIRGVIQRRFGPLIRRLRKEREAFLIKTAYDA